MTDITSASPGILAAKFGSSSSSMSRRQRLEQAVQKFEGLLWDEVAQAMSSVKMGPSTGGYGGKVYQQMMWRKVASQDFAGSDRALTKTTMDQLMGSSTTTGTATTRDTATLLSAAANTRASAPSQRAGVSGASAAADAQSWVHKIWREIKSGAEALGVPPKGLLAQAALETGWGKHATGHNLFGVKAHGNGESFAALTREFDRGVLRQVRSQFQQYPSAQHAMQDFVSVLKHWHPQAVGQGTVSGYAQALQASGYATDPRYAAKIEAVANSPRMQHILAEVKKSRSATNNE